MTAAATTTAPTTGPVTKLFRVGFIGSGGISRTQMGYLAHKVGAEAQIAQKDEQGSKGQHPGVLPVGFRAKVSHYQYGEAKRKYFDE